MTTTLYLDYDGVLHPDAVYREKDRIVLRRDGLSLFEWAPLLDETLAGFPGVQIVLSTSWVRVLSFATAKTWLPAGLQARVVGATYHSEMRPPSMNRYDPEPFVLLTRYEQILQHVQRHSIERWIALDDDHEHWPADQRHRLVALDGELGIAEPGKLSELAQKLGCCPS